MTVATAASALDCKEMSQGNNIYALCEVDARTADIRMFLKDAQDEPLGQFDTLKDMLEGKGLSLVFGMNGGMYHDDRAPVGLFIENGVQHMRLVRGASPGNFGLVPNGVFCIRDDRADVIETEAYAADTPDCDFATQSGPMLVIDGEIHPKFLPDSTSRFIRNGVGTSADGSRVVFVISRIPVTFHEFARFFRDDLGLPNALFLDGNISRIYAPPLNRDDRGFRMGPIIGVVAPAD
ncbi:phosphodiester glycosidase family protein [Aestuariivita boseongensis]|uniref:phosphodiester glycosidase family protein n=1 Tax=Aestuariivita boseongensis TaxID=1470562 RepID=UPI0006823CF6|nr:phosphodiester glycosidase family protein [Aestuariivita boseongensis]